MDYLSVHSSKYSFNLLKIKKKEGKLFRFRFRQFRIFNYQGFIFAGKRLSLDKIISSHV